MPGCQSAFGPQALERTHPACNEAIIASINEQMLQNLVRMRYRGHWFYMEDTDPDTKSTFMLLRQLFDLQAGQKQSAGPALTLPVR